VGGVVDGLAGVREVGGVLNLAPESELARL
jgi:hypothetical protein